MAAGPLLPPSALRPCLWFWVHPPCVPLTHGRLLIPPFRYARQGLPLTLHHSHICWGRGECLTVSVVPIFVLTPTSSPRLPVCPPLGISVCGSLRCVDLQDVLVCWAGSLLLNYSCLTCDFKGRDLEVSPHCHDADVTSFHDFRASHFLGPYQAGGPWAGSFNLESLLHFLCPVDRGTQELKILTLVDRLKGLMPWKAVILGAGMQDPGGQQTIQSLCPRGLQGRWYRNHHLQGGNGGTGKELLINR